MNADILAGIGNALGMAFLLGALATALAAAMARSLFMMCMCLASASACVAAAVMSAGAGEAALPLALFGVGLAPVLMLGGMLLSARAAKARALGPVLMTSLAAAATGVAILYAAPELDTPRAHDAIAPTAVAPWLAALLFVAAIGCAALLGYGERGAFAEPKR